MVRAAGLAALLISLSILGSVQASLLAGPTTSLPPIPTLDPPPVPAVPAALPGTGNWSIVWSDPHPNSGNEVAAHAIDGDTAIVVHKRSFVQLVAVRTDDAGATWTETVIDPFTQVFSHVDEAVAIDGFGDDVYVVYLEWPSYSYADMELKFAHSADRGVTWTTGTVVDGYAGKFVGLEVVNATTAIASYRVEGFNQGLGIAVTQDGGLTWQQQHLGNPYSAYTSVGSSDADHIYVSHYDSGSGYSPQGDTSLNVATTHDGGSTWDHQIIMPKEGDYTGLGSDIVSPSPQVAYVAYEDSQSGSGSVVFVSRTRDGGETWDHVVVGHGRAVGNGHAGVNQDVEAFGTDDVAVSYWFGDPGLYQPFGRARVAISDDGGDLWRVEVVPEPNPVSSDIDLAAADLDSMFVAYQVSDGSASRLHIAHRTP